MFSIKTLLRVPVATERVNAAASFLERMGMESARAHFDSWKALHVALGSDPSSIAIVDPFYGGSFAIEEVRQACRLTHAFGCIAYMESGKGRKASDVADLLDAGVCQVVTLSMDDSPRGFAGAISACTGFATITELVQPFLPMLTPSQRMILRWSIKHGTERTSVAQIAKELEIPARTLRRWCEGLDGVSTADFLSWGRMLHAARMLSETDMSLEAVCVALGFSDVSDLRRKFERVTGRPLSATDRGEALAAVVKGMRDGLLEASG